VQPPVALDVLELLAALPDDVVSGRAQLQAGLAEAFALPGPFARTLP
jgi:hypothetical protein